MYFEVQIKAKDNQSAVKEHKAVSTSMITAAKTRRNTKVMKARRRKEQKT